MSQEKKGKSTSMPIEAFESVVPIFRWARKCETCAEDTNRINGSTENPVM